MAVPQKDMTQKNTAFDVLQSEDRITRRYSINVPFQITYEFCSGCDADDRINALTLSEKGAYLWQGSMQAHSEEFRSIAAHSHDYYEWMIVLEGAVSQYIEGKVYRYEAGQACLVNRNLRHKEQFLEQARILFLGLSEEYLRSLFDSVQDSAFREERRILDTPLYHFIQADLLEAGQKVYLDLIPTIQNTDAAGSAPAGYRHLHDLTESLLSTLLHPSFGTSRLADGLMASLLGFLADTDRYHCSRVELTRDIDFLLFLHVEHLLMESAGRLTRSDLADRLSYSGDYISRVVRKYSGLSLQTYRLQFSLREAASLLRHSGRPVEEIARSLGFTNRTYFYRVFEEKYGMTPRRYRLSRQDDRTSLADPLANDLTAPLTAPLTNDLTDQSG